MPLDKLKILIDWLRGAGPAPHRNVLIHTVLDLIGWAADITFPVPGTAAVKFAVPAWLLPLLFQLLQRFIVPGASAVAATKDVDEASAAQLETLVKDQKQPNGVTAPKARG